MRDKALAPSPLKQIGPRRCSGAPRARVLSSASGEINTPARRSGRPGARWPWPGLARAGPLLCPELAQSTQTKLGVMPGPGPVT